uniref:Monocarboxylate transporter n=1 Tax=Hirondellea gigas TaxID=1518452 RepID=A0A6A7FTT1_9CRUS
MSSTNTHLTNENSNLNQSEPPTMSKEQNISRMNNGTSATNCSKANHNSSPEMSLNFPILVENENISNSLKNGKLSNPPKNGTIPLIPPMNEKNTTFLNVGEVLSSQNIYEIPISEKPCRVITNSPSSERGAILQNPRNGIDPASLPNQEKCDNPGKSRTCEVPESSPNPQETAIMKKSSTPEVLICPPNPEEEAILRKSRTRDVPTSSPNPEEDAILQKSIPHKVSSISRNKEKSSDKSRGPPSPTSPPVFTPPDGGYGWVVVFAACMAQVWIIGFIKSYSVLYVEILAEFPESTAYHASWIPALLTTVGLLISPFAGAMCQRYTARKVSIIGSLLCFLGLFLSCFVTSLTQLIFTLGAITGLGTGLITTPGVLIVNLYFHKRRSLASAICVSGNAIGGFLMPPLVEFLLSEYKLRGTFLITAALQLNIAAAAALYRPTDDHARVQEMERRKLAKEAAEENFEYNQKLIVKTQDQDANMNFYALDVRSNLKSECQVNPLSTLQRSKVDENITRELSMYRSMSITGSVVSLKYFLPDPTKVSKSPVTLRKPKKRTQSERRSSEYGETNIPSNLSNDNLMNSKRMKSLSELVTSRSSTVPVSEVSNSCRPTPKSLLPAQCINGSPLHRIAITNNEAQSGKSVLMDNSSTANKLNIYDAKNSLNETKFTEYNNSPSRDSTGSFASLKRKYLERSLLNTSIDEKEVVTETDECIEYNLSYADGTFKDDEKKEQYSSEDQAKPPNCLAILLSSFDKELLKKPAMILVCISSCLVAFGAPHSLFYVHVYFTNANVDSTVVTKILSFTSLVDLVGRLTAGYIADTKVIKLHYMYFFYTALAGVCSFCVPMTSSLWSIALVLSLHGFGVGAWVVMMPTQQAAFHGIEKLPASYGFTRMVMGITNFISPQISGALIDSTGSYSAIYYFMGSCIMLASLVQYYPQCSSKEESETCSVADAETAHPEHEREVRRKFDEVD